MRMRMWFYGMAEGIVDICDDSLMHGGMSAPPQ
jgi:hypothetical protein